MILAKHQARSPWLLWALLSAPALVWLIEARDLAGFDLEALLQPTGELSARLLILALMLTPLARLFPRVYVTAWLVRRRRAIGVAAFGYAVLHTLFYVLAMGSIADMAAEFSAPGIWTGWAALLLMLPLALTSNDAAMRWLRAGWKRLQRLAYPVAILTLAHWVLVHDSWQVAALHFVPLALLQAWRMLNLYPDAIYPKEN